MNVGEMQRKLSLWAEQDKERRFIDLLKLICGMDWLRRAHDYVAQNAGSVTAGCDGIAMGRFDKSLEENLRRIAEALKSGAFQPYPVRRVCIPRSNGKAKPLGMLSVRDRIVQEAVRMVLEPIYEADFSPYSFGFRPNRCRMDAIKCITWSVLEHKRFFWVMRGEISSCFDTMHHRRLMRWVERRIEDRRLLNLLWRYLQAEVMEKKLFRDTESGTPQGGIVGPLLANIYLHELDRYVERHTALSRTEKTKRRTSGQANYAYIRYADEFVVLCNGTRQQAEAVKEEVCRFLKERLRLELPGETTGITHLNDGFEFLGFRIQRKLGQKGMTTKVLIPKEAVEKVKGRIARITAPRRHQDSVNSTILALNRVIGEWCRYYQHTSKVSATFRKVGYYVFWRMAHWLGRKYRVGMTDVMRMFKSGTTFATPDCELIMPTDFSSRPYRRRFKKPNPYTTQEMRIEREELPTEMYWYGQERTPGMSDLRPMIMIRDDYTCQVCGTRFVPKDLEVDHIRPVRRFRRPAGANRLDNLRAICRECHRKKTESDR